VSKDIRNKHRAYYRSYVVLNQEAAALIAVAELTLADHKILNAALSRMNDFGHAEFGRGELTRLVGVSRPTVYRSKKRLHKAGFLEEVTGGESCVWVSSRVAFRGKKGSRCPVHRG
jgi:DNA-binding MarR family transcriptional regulator